LGEDGAQRRRHHLLRDLGHGGQRVAHEVDPATLPAGTNEDLSHRLLETKVGVGDDQTDTA
jgi:hypothetical protein